MQMPFDDGPMSQVREGMHVIDSAGEEVGRVQAIQMGDPEADTVSTAQRSEGLIDATMHAVAGGGGEPDVPEPFRSRLLRSGYVKIDGPDLMDTDRYVSSDDIREVSGERVMLRLRKDELVREA